jgi:hypothetical protein
MIITIGERDDEKRVVSVTFEHGGETVIRDVNAVYTDDVYDDAATVERVDQVGLGVEYKIDNGIIKTYVPPEPPEEVPMSP